MKLNAKVGSRGFQCVLVAIFAGVVAGQVGGRIGGATAVPCHAESAALDQAQAAYVRETRKESLGKFQRTDCRAWWGDGYCCVECGGGLGCGESVRVGRVECKAATPEATR